MNVTSHPWKQHLTHQADALHQMTGPHRGTEASSIKLEECVLLGCYAIRRLINAYLLPESSLHRPVPMTAYPRLRQPTPILSDAPIQTRYDLQAGKNVSHDLLFFCHQVLHNCHFELRFAADKSITGILVTSDHQRKVALYGIELSTIETLFRDIGESK